MREIAYAAGEPGGDDAEIDLPMLEFSARHEIAPETEVAPMSEVNAAFKRLHQDSPPQRLVLKLDFDQRRHRADKLIAF